MRYIYTENDLNNLNLILITFLPICINGNGVRSFGNGQERYKNTIAHSTYVDEQFERNTWRDAKSCGRQNATRKCNKREHVQVLLQDMNNFYHTNIHWILNVNWLILKASKLTFFTITLQSKLLHLRQYYVRQSEQKQ